MNLQKVLTQIRAHGLPNDKSILLHDLAGLRARLAELKKAFPEDTLHAIAIKANPLVEVLRSIVDEGFGLEAASWEEVQLALAAGCPPKNIVFDSPAKTDDEIKQALKQHITLNVDHEEELVRLADLGATRASRIGLRVNPQLGEGSIAFTSTVGKTSKFGVPLASAPELFKRFPFLSGLHVHTGSQGCGLALLKDAAFAVGKMAVELKCEFLDIGGGIPVRYTDADTNIPSYADWADALREMPGWGTISLITEVGRSVHSSLGVAISRIEGVKEVNGQNTVIIHLGADFLLRRVYQASHWDHEFVVLNPDGSEKQDTMVPTQIAGPLCFAGDILARQRALSAAKAGDLLLIRDVGAYTLSMWSRHCSRGLPPTFGVDGEKVRVLHRGEVPSDVVSFWSNRKATDNANL